MNVSNMLKTIMTKHKSLFKLEDILNWGDDYELIFTANVKYSEHILDISKKFDFGLTKIGKMTQELGFVLDGESIKQKEIKMGYGHL